MSFAEMLSNGSIREIEQSSITLDTLKLKDKVANQYYLHTIDSLGHYHITGQTGAKLLSFSPSNGLNDCAVKQHVSTQVNASIALLTQQYSQLQAANASLLSTINVQQVRIATLETYINNTKVFFNAFKQSIFIEDSQGSNQEFDYENIV